MMIARAGPGLLLLALSTAACGDEPTITVQAGAVSYSSLLASYEASTGCGDPVQVDLQFRNAGELVLGASGLVPGSTRPKVVEMYNDRIQYFLLSEDNDAVAIELAPLPAASTLADGDVVRLSGTYRFTRDVALAKVDDDGEVSAYRLQVPAQQLDFTADATFSRGICVD
jgi:hypothetical protein